MKNVTKLVLVGLMCVSMFLLSFSPATAVKKIRIGTVALFMVR